MSREQSTMASTWTELLGLADEGDGGWSLAVYGYEWLGSIYDLIPEEELYDEDGGLKVPEEYDGHRILGVVDGEYLETDELVMSSEDDSVWFDKSTIDEARRYAALHSWDKAPGFEDAWRELLKIVGASSEQPTLPHDKPKRRRPGRT